MINSLLADGTSKLQQCGISNAQQEACWLLAQVLDKENIYDLPSGLPVTAEAAATFHSRLARRCTGEPLQYIMGNTDFHCLRLEVGPGVLIPRPETEQLVEIARELYPGEGAIADLCTGSGAIALVLGKLFPQATVIGTDLSEAALGWASRNLTRLRLPNVSFQQGDLGAALPDGSGFALITANPPYVSPAEYLQLEKTVRDHEPKMALVAENEGMAIFQRLAQEIKKHLLPNAWLVCEIGNEQGQKAKDFLNKAGYHNVTVQKDYFGQDRFARGQQPA